MKQLLTLLIFCIILAGCMTKNGVVLHHSLINIASHAIANNSNSCRLQVVERFGLLFGTDLRESDLRGIFRGMRLDSGRVYPVLLDSNGIASIKICPKRSDGRYVLLMISFDHSKHIDKITYVVGVDD